MGWCNVQLLRFPRTFENRDQFWKAENNIYRCAEEVNICAEMITGITVGVLVSGVLKLSREHRRPLLPKYLDVSKLWHHHVSAPKTEIILTCFRMSALWRTSKRDGCQPTFPPQISIYYLTVLTATRIRWWVSPGSCDSILRLQSLAATGFFPLLPRLKF